MQSDLRKCELLRISEIGEINSSFFMPFSHLSRRASHL